MKSFSILCLVLFFAACTANRKITQIDLRNRHLEYLPDSVFQYQHAKALQAGPGWVAVAPLGDAEVSGGNSIRSLPTDLRRLSRLQFLGLSYNKINTLPSCFIELRHLEILDLSFNRELDIHQALPLILQLPNLKELNLCGIASVTKDSTWVKEQLKARHVLLSITMQDLVRNYSRQR